MKKSWVLTTRKEKCTQDDIEADMYYYQRYFRALDCEIWRM